MDPNKAARKRAPAECAKSILLTSEENGIAERLIGPRATSLATAVVQIYLSDKDSGHSRLAESHFTIIDLFFFVKNQARKYSSFSSNFLCYRQAETTKYRPLTFKKLRKRNETGIGGISVSSKFKIL